MQFTILLVEVNISNVNIFHNLLLFYKWWNVIWFSSEQSMVSVLQNKTISTPNSSHLL